MNYLSEPGGAAVRYGLGGGLENQMAVQLFNTNPSTKITKTASYIADQDPQAHSGIYEALLRNKVPASEIREIQFKVKELLQDPLPWYNRPTWRKRLVFGAAFLAGGALWYFTRKKRKS